MKYVLIGSLFAILASCAVAAHATQTQPVIGESDNSVPFNTLHLPHSTGYKLRPNMGGAPVTIQGGFVSGTAFDIWFNIVWPDGPDHDGIEDFTLTVNGTSRTGGTVNQQVASASLPSGKTWYWHLGDRIDTTYFMNGSTLSITALADPIDTTTVDTPCIFNLLYATKGLIFYVPLSIHLINCLKQAAQEAIRLPRRPDTLGTASQLGLTTRGTPCFRQIILQPPKY